MEISIELLLNLPSLRVTDCVLSDKEAHIYCESIIDSGNCPSCGKATSEVTMYSRRTVRDMALLGRKVSLHVQTRQFHCSDCSRYFSERFDFVEPSKTMTTRYEQYIYFSTLDICISQVSIKEDICWPTVYEIHRRYSKKQVQSRDVWSSVRYLGIDEISIRKGTKNYACCLVNLERGIVLDFLPSRLKGDLVSYFEQKGAAFCAQIEVVSSDMWDGYTTLADAVFPNAITVIDRYHFFVHFNKALHTSRSQLRKEFPDEEVFKHLRWALLKNPENLSLEEQLLLQKAFAISEELSQMYQLRKDLKQIFDTDQSIAEARVVLDQWEEKASKMANKPMQKFLTILANWKDKIVNFFQDRLSNGVVEGLNNAIRGIIRRSFGFHNFDNLRLRVLSELG